MSPAIAPAPPSTPAPAGTDELDLQLGEGRLLSLFPEVPVEMAALVHAHLLDKGGVRLCQVRSLCFVLVLYEYAKRAHAYHEYHVISALICARNAGTFVHFLRFFTISRKSHANLAIL